VPGAADVGEALVTHPDVKVIAFTGSTAVGRQIGRLLKRVGNLDGVGLRESARWPRPMF
jgi:acyl-CoA reductase-like NAD-dependent aldehyde dehydrogenase